MAIRKNTKSTGVGNQHGFETKKEYYADKSNIGSFDAILDEKYGKVGTPERDAFHREAYAYCVGQIILDARKQERMTQSDLAKKVGTDKTYISRIEKGAIEPGVGLFFRIMDALGLKVEIARPLM